MKFVDIHFFIDSGYQWGKGLAADKIQAFDKEIVGLFLAAGWEIKEKRLSGASSTVVLGKNKLYLHPMEASGELDEELVEVVEAILEQGKTFKRTETRIVGNLVDLSDEEYLAQLEAKRDEIEAALLVACKTKRKNSYTSAHSVVEAVKERYHIQRLVAHIGRSGNDVEWKYVEQVYKDLKDSGKIVTHPERNYYCRAA